MDKATFVTRRTKIISAMLDNPDVYGIYPTSECFRALDNLFDEITGCTVKSEIQEVFSEALEDLPEEQEMSPLDRLKCNLQTKAFGTVDPEKDYPLCIACKQPVDILSLAFIDRSEFKISQVCPTCFDNITYFEEDN